MFGLAAPAEVVLILIEGRVKPQGYDESAIIPKLLASEIRIN